MIRTALCCCSALVLCTGIFTVASCYSSRQEETSDNNCFHDDEKLFSIISNMLPTNSDIDDIHQLLRKQSDSTIISAVQCVNIPISEFNALQSIYDSASGDGWRWLVPYDQYGFPWSFSNLSSYFGDPYPNSNPCIEQWQGVTCSPCTSPHEEYHITELILNTMDMHGSVSSAIANLTHLVTLEMEKNHFLTGPFPSWEWVRLTSLRTISFAYSRLSGKIPMELFSLNNSLLTLDLYYNKMTGPIPAEISQLTYLRQ